MTPTPERQLAERIVREITTFGVWEKDMEWLEQTLKEAFSNRLCRSCGCNYESCCCNPIREMQAAQQARLAERGRCLKLIEEWKIWTPDHIEKLAAQIRGGK